MATRLKGVSMDPNFWISVISCFGACAAAFFAWQVGQSADRTNLEGQLHSQLSLYLQNYQLLFGNEEKNPFEVNTYISSSVGVKKQTDANGAMLVDVIDLMFELKDERRNTWARFLFGLNSLLICHQVPDNELESFAKEIETKQAIVAARTMAINSRKKELNRITNKEYCPTDIALLAN